MNILSMILVAFFALFACGHVVLAFFRIAGKRPGFSSVPLVNGVLGAVGLALSESSVLSSKWWIPFLVDWGCLPLLVESLVWRTRRRMAPPGC